MSRANAILLAGFLTSFLIVLAGATLAKGGFMLGKHEGDTLHLLDIVFRMAAGELPHLDFVTPIGLFATLPIALLVKVGLGAGQAMILSQVIVAALFLPAIWWVAATRFRDAVGWIFGAVILILILALVHGTTERSVSFSMHYNRWAWAAAFLAITTAILPSLSPRHHAVDGIVIGLAVAVMAMTKATYFVAFAPPILVALLAHRAGRSLLWAIGSGLIVAGLVTLAAGIEFWLAYLDDLRTVAGSDVRPNPGETLQVVIGAPAYMAGSLLLILSAILLRQAGRMTEGMVLLLLAPGFFYVTYQNYGNDPQWLALLGVLLWTLRPTREVHNALGWDVGKGLSYTAVAVLALATPSYTNLAYSPFRHLSVSAADYMAMLPGTGVHEDLRVATSRNQRVDAKIPVDGPDTPYAWLDAGPREDEVTFQGETLPICASDAGLSVWLRTFARDMDDSGLVAGKAVFTADLLPSVWMFSDAVPLKGGAPWYYGGLSGFDNADLVFVPLCPLVPKVRKLILEEITKRGATLTEVRRTDLYILYEK
ncbi:hypothetical protein [Aliiroseovarius subalbicans]|uniref:hypothetical protein n=1 Tax=Aliiroseovarius subalbicans TaxID=2925840 RepID=UPI001F594492|nr:hypothetical protein [Aliiroseovarius subalbicans]MCI2397956.1 hypothetical protein [Aliiroseovarius subalbicans]